MGVGDELEPEGVVVDCEKAAGVGETEVGGASGGPASAYGFGRSGPWTEAPPGAKTLAQHDAAHFFEGVAHDVAVNTDAEGDTFRDERAHVGEAVAQVALGGRAETDGGSCLAEQARFARGNVSGVDGDESLRQRALVGEELDRAAPRFLEARLDFGGLLGDMHMQREAQLGGETCDLSEPRWRNGPHAVRRDADTDFGVAGIPGRSEERRVGRGGRPRVE